MGVYAWVQYDQDGAPTDLVGMPTDLVASNRGTQYILIGPVTHRFL